VHSAKWLQHQFAWEKVAGLMSAWSSHSGVVVAIVVVVIVVAVVPLSKNITHIAPVYPTVFIIGTLAVPVK